jgi:LPXTG-site transpeptidase (sortase) family protein
MGMLARWLSQKRFVVALATAVVVLCGTAGLTSLLTGRQQTRQVNAHPSAVTEKKSQTQAKQVRASIGLPVRLKIPKIGVDAPIDQMGLTSEGDMDTPKIPGNAGWFSQGPRPGEVGSSVIDGHFGWKNNLPAVFDNLHLLKAGDTLSVVDEEGAATTFTVRELRTFGRDGDATEVFRSNDGKAHLNLITCQGSWNERQKSYSTRLVVFTDKAN